MKSRSLPLGMALAGLVLAGCSTPAESLLEESEAQFHAKPVPDDAARIALIGRYRKAFDMQPGLHAESKKARDHYRALLEADTTARLRAAAAKLRLSGRTESYESVWRELLDVDRDRWAPDSGIGSRAAAAFLSECSPAYFLMLRGELETPEGYERRVHLLARARTLYGDSDTRIESFARAEPDTQAVALEESGDLRGAASRFGAAFDADPSNPFNRARERRLAARIVESERLRLAAAEAERSHDLENAAQLLEKSAALHARQPELESLSKLIRARLEAYRLAETSCIEALAAGDFDGAREAAERACRDRPSEPSAKLLESAWSARLVALRRAGDRLHAYLAAHALARELRERAFPEMSWKSETRGLVAHAITDWVRESSASVAYTGNTEAASLIARRYAPEGLAEPLRVALTYVSDSEVRIVSRTPRSESVPTTITVANPARAPLQASLDHARDAARRADCEESEWRRKSRSLTNAAKAEPDARKRREALASIDCRRDSLSRSSSDASATVRELESALASTPSTVESVSFRTLSYTTGVARGRGAATMTLRFPDSTEREFASKFDEVDSFVENPSNDPAAPSDALAFSRESILEAVTADVMSKTVAELRVRLAAHTLAVAEAGLVRARASGDAVALMRAESVLACIRGDVVALDALAARAFPHAGAVSPVKKAAP